MNATKTKRIQRTTLASSSVYRRRKTYHDGLLCVCIFRGARSKRKRLRFSSYWSKRKIFFFLWRERRETKKNIKNGSQKRKNSKILLLFCSFFALWTGDRNLFVFCEVILYTAHTKTRGTEEREREVWEGERNLLAFFLSSSVTVFLLCRLDGERERVILNFRSFVRCFPIASSSSRDETRERHCY